MTTHAVPTGPLTDATLPCCGITFADLQPGDRVVSEESKVTCGGGS